MKAPHMMLLHWYVSLTVALRVGLPSLQVHRHNTLPFVEVSTPGTKDPPYVLLGPILSLDSYLPSRPA